MSLALIYITHLKKAKAFGMRFKKLWSYIFEHNSSYSITAEELTSRLGGSGIVKTISDGIVDVDDLRKRLNGWFDHSL